MENHQTKWENAETLKNSLLKLKKDVKEEGNIWKDTKQGDGFKIRETIKPNIYATCYKVEGELPITTKDLLEKILIDTDSVRKITSVESITVAKEGDIENIHYQLYRQTHVPVYGGMIAGRDFSIVRCWEFIGNDLWFTCFSVQDPEIPENPNFVRGFLHQVSWHAFWDSSKSVCKAEHIVHTDVKGSLPGWVVSKGIVGEVSTTFPKTIQVINELGISTLK